jgi:hypothetical protein
VCTFHLQFVLLEQLLDEYLHKDARFKEKCEIHGVIFC